MAALSQRQDNSEHVSSILRKENLNEVFTPKETLDQRWDVILVGENGKELKAHKQVLSEASPFFEKLLNSDMKESREGIVRLEMFSESALRNTLQFIYTGTVQILAEDNARDLVVSADYFILPNLKPLAEGALGEMLNTSNCISAYYFPQTYQCEELLVKTEKYIIANFTSVYETNREEVLNMSNKEMEKWLSGDAINVSSEEDVFKIILAWINRDRNKRQQYFAELFRHVRLAFCIA
ncbi:kelch-like protein 2 [Orbicella faveolata]|uniref:kelch-like protein 2 n=1 Tax=Orbicella faveolata TaxID=48498 RepID=UPI0009E5D966|nr:kelch-like protein 2 [Orbicella faveolata]